MQEQHFHWHSPILDRNIDMLVFGHTGYPVVLFPTSMGSFHENKDMGLIESVRWYVEEGLIQIYCPDSIDKDSFYNKQVAPHTRIHNHGVYDRFICHEVVEKIKDHTAVGKVVVAGCSFGGYHAANFAFRHPGYVSHMFSMSGAFGIKSFMEGYWSDDVFYHSPEDYLPGLNDASLWQMDVVLGTSNWDICFDDNLRLHRILEAKHLPHWLDIRPDRQHDWPLWKEMFPHYLSRIRF